MSDTSNIFTRDLKRCFRSSEETIPRNEQHNMTSCNIIFPESVKKVVSFFKSAVHTQQRNCIMARIPDLFKRYPTVHCTVKWGSYTSFNRKDTFQLNRCSFQILVADGNCLRCQMMVHRYWWQYRHLHTLTEYWETLRQLRNRNPQLLSSSMSISALSARCLRRQCLRSTRTGMQVRHGSDHHGPNIPPFAQLRPPSTLVSI